ncbi:MAG: sulfatase-like hydrolase/transferase [Candidatus Sumerlaeota bacterium]|nr:sulfatase-like hydrolase/transferase [Candidatus Sumerlaeota bacterium]
MSSAWAQPRSAATAKPAPNIVLMLADDLGYGDLGCYGAKDIRTPRIDRLAREGVRFTQYYSNGPECTPTRAALLTGRYQQRVGGLECAIGTGNVGRYDDAIRLAANHELGLPEPEMTIARLLKDAGFATAITGKWHLGYEDKFSPNRHGFDHAFYVIGGGMEYFHHVEDPPGYAPALRLNGAPVERRGYATDLFADEAVRWLREHAAKGSAKPFFLYLPFTASNTLVFFLSDNGGTISARSSGLRGIKGSAFEGGIRVPCIVRWPGALPVNATVSYPALTFDLTASIARAAGVNAPASRPFDGMDILRCIERNEAPPARALFWRGRRGEGTWRAVREGSLKLVTHTQGARLEEFLFDMDRDPGESSDLLAQRPTDAARLRQLLAAWELEVKPPR